MIQAWRPKQARRGAGYQPGMVGALEEAREAQRCGLGQAEPRGWCGRETTCGAISIPTPAIRAGPVRRGVAHASWARGKRP